MKKEDEKSVVEILLGGDFLKLAEVNEQGVLVFRVVLPAEPLKEVKCDVQLK